MAELHRTKASLRIFGDDLIPKEITAKLGCEPTFSQYKGEVIVGKKAGRERIATFGGWRLHATEAEPGDLNAQIMEIANCVSTDIEVWQELSSKYRIDLFCGLFMENWSEGIVITPKCLKILGERNIELSLDIYGPDNE